MSFMDGLFGGGSSKSKSSSTPVDMTPAALKGLQNPFASATKSLLGTGTGGGLSGVPSPTGPLVAPMSNEEQAAVAQFSVDDPLQAARRNYLTSAIGGNFLPGQAGSNPFLQASIEAAQRPVLQGLTDTLTRDLPGRFTQAGQFVGKGGSSPFDFAAARATGDTANALGDIAAKMNFQGYDAERQRQQEAVQLGQQEVQTMVQNLQALALPRLIADQGIERGQEIFKTRLSALLQALGVAGQASQPTIANKQESTSTTKQSGGIVPGVASLVSAFKQ